MKIPNPADRSIHGALLRHPSFHFHPDAGSGDAGAAGAAAGGAEPVAAPATEPAAEPNVIPKSEAQKAFADRDNAKRLFNLTLAQFGLERSDAKLIAQPDNPDEPFRVEYSDRAKEVLKLIEAKKADETETQKAKLHTTAYERYIDAVAGQAELKNALIAEGAIDTLNDGTLSDHLAILGNRIRVDRKVDKDGTLHVSVKVLDASGKVMEGKTVSDLAAEHLAARPSLKKATVRPGPGAGGYGDPRGVRGPSYQPAMTPRERGEAAADRMFGRPAGFSNLRPTNLQTGTPMTPAERGAAAADQQFGAGFNGGRRPTRTIIPRH